MGFIRRCIPIAALAIGLLAGQDQPLALSGVTVIDATGQPPQLDMTVLISGGRIAGISPTNAVKLPPGTRIEDCTGKFLIPGLWDMHVHLSGASDLDAQLFAANGVTSIREMGGNLVTIDWLRRSIDRGTLAGPRVFRAGPFVDGLKPGLADRLVPSSAEEGRDAVRYLKQLGVDFIKVHTGVPRSAYLASMDEAKKQGIAVAGHFPLEVTPVEASNAGQRTIEHMSVLAEKRATELMNGGMSMAQVSEVVAGEMPELFRTMARNTTWIDPTFVAMRESAYHQEIAARPDDRRKYIPPSVKRGWDRMFPAKQEDPKTRAIRAELFQTQLTWAAKMKDVGVRFIAGTDTGIPDTYSGFSLHEELGLLVKAGFTEMEALQAATRNAATVMGQATTLGTVEVGKYADLVILDANPLADVANTTRIHAVVMGGRILLRDALDTLLAKVEALAPQR
jgi:imidazolonepropionase-like amidohydrolase